MIESPDLDRTGALLRKVFPHNEHFADERYLHWWYRTNPYGNAIEHDMDEDANRIAHTAYVPNRFVDAGNRDAPPMIGALSCDSAVDPDLQRGGVFKKFQNEASELATAAGIEFGFGCANWNSLVVFQKHLGWRHVQPLPVKVLLPLPGAHAETKSLALDGSANANQLLDEVVADIDRFSAAGLHAAGNSSWYQWRTSSPTNAFSLHVSEAAAILTTRVIHARIPVAVIVRSIARGTTTDRAMRPLVRAACRHHRAPIALHVGFNYALRIDGFTPPRKALPSPLHMCVKSLQPHIDQDALEFSTYELLDFDAY